MNAATLFPAPVAVLDSTVVMGAPGSDYAWQMEDQTCTSTWNGTAWLPASPLPVPQTGGLEVGGAVALQGSLAALGAPADVNQAGVATGSVTVLTPNGNQWVPQARLIPADGTAGGRFGLGVALDGDTLVVGARDKSYVYQRSGSSWVETAILNDPNPEESNGLVRAVAIKGGLIAVGVPYSNEAEGRVHLYSRTAGNWQRTATLNPGDLRRREKFGAAVAIMSDLIIVGTNQGRAFLPTTPAPSPRVHVFKPAGGSGWIRTATLLPTVPVQTFGSGLAVSGSSVLVGGTLKPVDGETRLVAGFDFQWKAGKWTGGKVLMSAPGYDLRAVAYEEHKALLSHDEVGLVDVFGSSGGAWSARAQLEEYRQP